MSSNKQWRQRRRLFKSLTLDAVINDKQMLIFRQIRFRRPLPTSFRHPVLASLSIHLMITITEAD